MKPIKIAIVGRPNVGKSSLFNRICKKRIAIAHEEEGVTRDRIYGLTDFFDKTLRVIDTGGIDSHSDLPFKEEVKNQAFMGIAEAEGIIMVVDSRTGMTALDEEVAQILLKSRKPLVLAVNKVDNPDKAGSVHDFQGLGIKKCVAVSAIQGFQIAEVLEELLEDISSKEPEDAKKERVKVAIVGRANVGKSTLLNALFKDNRSIVSDIPGTTRDSIDAKVLYKEKEIIFVDTAGIRRKKSEKDVIEKFAAIRTQKAIERADLCLLILDAREGMTSEEKRIASMIEKAGKGCILLFNKWDLINGFRMEHCLQAVKKEVPFLEHCPTKFISAKSGRNLEGIYEDIEEVEEQLKTRLKTGLLNRFLEKCMQRVTPPRITGKRLRVYYLTQIATSPPKFVFFVNHPDLLTMAYKKYLINQFRKTYAFKGAPLFFKVKKKTPREENVLQ